MATKQSDQTDMAGGLNLDDDEGIVDINITPFVDVMLVLLVIFMVAATYIVKPSIELELPKAASGGETLDKTLSIALSVDGQLFLNGEKINHDALGIECAQLAKDNPKVQAMISADKRVLHGEVVKLIDLVRLNGVLSFAINIDPQVIGGD
jgi:biopolymer transport protein ExbD